MISASVPALASLSDGLEAEEEVNTVLLKLPLVMVFISTAESKLEHTASHHVCSRDV